MGYNLAALKYLKSRWEGDKVAGMMIEDEWDEGKVREKMGKPAKGKRKRVGIRA